MSTRRVVSRGLFACALGALLVAGAGRPALAQMMSMEGSGMSQRRVTFGIGGGVSVPVSDAKDVFKNGFNGHAFAQINLAGFPIQPRIDFTFSRLDFKDVTAQYPDATGVTGGYSSLIGGMAQAKWPLTHGRFQPYVLAGLGANNLSTTLQGTETANPSSVTKFTVEAGAGFTYRLSQVSFYAEGRLSNFYGNGELVDFNTVQTVPVTFGLMY